MNRKLVFLQAFFYILVLSGCTLLSIHNDQNAAERPISYALWLTPLLIGIVGSIYLAAAKKVRLSWLYGAPTIIFGIVVSILFPSTFSRIVVLMLFCALILATTLKAKVSGSDSKVSSTPA